MRILLSVSGYPPSRGGSELHCFEYAERLAGRGHVVEVVAPDLFYSADFYSLLGRPVPPADAGAVAGADNSIPVHRVPFLSGGEARLAAAVTRPLWPVPLRAFVGRALLWLVTRRYYRRVRLALAHRRADVMIVFVHLHPNVRASLRAARAMAVPSLYVPLLHEEDPTWPAEGVKACVAASDGVLANTAHEAGALVARYGARPDRVFLAGIGIDPPAIRLAPAADDVVPTILYVGRKTAGKGLLLLAEAVRLLNGRGLSFRVALVGSDADDTAAVEQRFAAILGDRFVSRTNVTDEEKQSWLSRSAVLALPSDRESFGIVLLEAWSHGRPVVTIGTPVAQEIVDQGSDGLLVPPNDAVALADALAELIGSPEMARRLGEAGRVKALTTYHWDRCIDALERACDTVRGA